MVKTFVAAIVLTIGLGGYAVAQDTAPGSPAGTKPMTPEPMIKCITTCIITSIIIVCILSTTTWPLRWLPPPTPRNKKKTRAPSATRGVGETRRRTGFGRGLLL
jgi:predicted secreted protein